MTTPRSALILAGSTIGCIFLLGSAPPERASTLELPELDTKHMLWGYFSAGSEIEDFEAFEYTPSDNMPQTLDRSFLVRARVSLHVMPEYPEIFENRDGKYAGFRVVLFNGTLSTESFRASDSRLPIIREAQNRAGTWVPIEYVPMGWCGHSRHRVFLGSGQYWVFSAPRYAGTVPVRMRFALYSGGARPVYSNEFDGRINPELFRQGRHYSPPNPLIQFID